MRIGSMFSGYSGLELGVQQVFDAQPVWFVEIEDAPARILAHHYPDVPNLGDVTRVDWASVPLIDVLTAGYPCQPFSLNGLRKGTNDERHLWPDVFNAIRVLRPRFALFENVRGHLTLGLDAVLSDLASIGWDAQWVVNRASDAGCPHHRERLFILAYPHGKRLETRRPPGGEAPSVPVITDSLSTFRRVSDPAQFIRECEARWGRAGVMVFRWAMLHGEPPEPVSERVTYHDEELWGKAFPEIRETLNPAFVEWCMGLPEGWVTGVPGLSRNQQLKALGNGVVPQQAGMALKQLLGELK